ncbi:flagellar biosynthesis/type III secretory pathway M-ring protein FliF/YscJ [Kroppenstedtia sanguinis]|uniref:hypothetical protein n=1 Tax=Kroppenstedtia sanguinis TaxID=1380684 RepID=UPI003D24DDED
MIAEWLEKIPVFVWPVLAVILILFFVVVFMVAGKRSKEVDELEQAFKEPYHPSPNEQAVDREPMATEKTGSEEEKEQNQEEPTDRVGDESMDAVDKPTDAVEEEPQKDSPAGLGSRSRRHRKGSR